LSNTLLVSNNTNSGTINAFNAITGAFVGTVRDTSGNVITIDQLWAIDFGGWRAKHKQRTGKRAGFHGWSQQQRRWKVRFHHV